MVADHLVARRSRGETRIGRPEKRVASGRLSIIENRNQHRGPVTVYRLISRSIISCWLTVGLTVHGSQYADGQSFQSNVQIRATGQASQPGSRQEADSSASGDLMQLYAETQSAKSETAVTSIARSCSDIVSDKGRSQADRDYAATLLAWALNRRGEMRNDRAAQLVTDGQFDQADRFDRLAAEDFQTAIEYDSSNWRSRHNYAISLAMAGDYSAAVDQLTAAIRLNPDYPNAHFNRGELYFETENYVEAIRDYTRAIELNPQDPQYFNSRAHSRFMLEEYDDALADYRQAAELGDDSATYQTDLADAYQFLGRWEEAATAYRAAVAINSKLPRAYQHAAWLMATCPEQRLRNAELARSAAKKAIELSGEATPQALDVLAAANAAAGDFAEAIRVQRQAIETVQTDAQRREFESRLQLYQQKRPYRQTTLAGTTSRSNEPQVRAASGNQGSAGR
jgi:tetratricopeptide (TPR) repeat protein